MQLPSHKSVSLAVKSVESKRTGVGSALFGAAWEASSQVTEHIFLASLADKLKDHVAEMDTLRWLGQHPHWGFGIGLAVWILVIVFKLGKEHASEHIAIPQSSLAGRDVNTGGGTLSVGQTLTQTVNDSPSARVVAGDYHETHVRHVDALAEARLEEFRQIDEVIVKKNEMQLREMFDFPDQMAFNIKRARHFHWPTLSSQSDLKEIDEFFVGGQGLIDLDSATRLQVGEDIRMTNRPGHIHIINMSRKFCDTRNVLMVLSSSSKLPLPVANALRELDAVLETNVKLIATTINESYAHNQRNIREADDTSSDRLHRTFNLYWTKFIDLKPRADATSNAIRDFLNAPKDI